jgi:hypothetical protein
MGITEFGLASFTTSMSSAMKGHLRYQAGSVASQAAVRGLGAPAGAVHALERASRKFQNRVNGKIEIGNMRKRICARFRSVRAREQTQQRDVVQVIGSLCFICVMAH